MAASEPNLALDTALGRIVQVLTPSQQEWERRRQLIDEHIGLLARQLNSPHPVHISTFGSSLSGLCLANSDIDLGLFGRFNGCLLEDLRPNQQQSLLRLVLKAVYAAKLARNQQVQAIWGARIPVLKYTCRLSGLDCDMSLQGTGALVKARFIYILNSGSRHLSALYRLVKLWAQVHDLNDASRSTFNSTSLLYMTIFYLQQLQVLPPLQELVPQELLLQPNARLLQGGNKQLWEDPQRLRQLFAAVQSSMSTWSVQQQHRQQHQQPPALSSLLLGFFQFWSGSLTDWVLERNRNLHADLWCGRWAPGSFVKQYIFSLQDPFDAADCPARAVGSSTNTNGGTAAFIAYMFSSSSKVMQRYMDNCKSQVNITAADGDWDGRVASWFEDWEQQQTPAAGAMLRVELCKLMAWLFGPKGVLLLGSPEPALSQQQQQGVAWAAAPFPLSLVGAVQQRQRQSQKSASLLTWLVEQLGAELDRDRNILCLNQLGLLTRQTSEAATAAAKQVRGARQQGAAQKHPAAPPPPLPVAAGNQNGHVAVATATQPAAARAGSSEAAAAAVVDQDASQQPSSCSGRVSLDGPGLPEPDDVLLQLGQQLYQDMEQLQQKRRNPTARPPPKRLPKAMKAAVQLSLAAVVGRVLQLQNQQGSGSSSSGRYGLLAVLQQHGFNELLQEHNFLADGVLWDGVLPTTLLEGSSSDAVVTSNNMASSSSSSSTAAVQQPVQPAPAAAASACDTPAADDDDAHAAGTSSRARGSLAQLLVSPSGKKHCHPAKTLKQMYQVVRAACQQQLLQAAAHGRHFRGAATAAAAATDQPKFTVVERPDPDGQQQWYAVVQLPELVTFSTAADGSLTMKQVIAPGTERSKLLKDGAAAASKSDTNNRNTAREALLWLGAQPHVVAGVRDALQVLQQGQQQQQGLQQGQPTQQQRQPVLPVQAALHDGQLQKKGVIDVTVVKARQQRNGATASAAATGAAIAAASVAAAAAAAGLTDRPNSAADSSKYAVTISLSHLQQQQQQGRRGKQPSAAACNTGANSVLDGLATLTLADGVDDTTLPAAAVSEDGLTKAAAEAVRSAYRQLRDVQSQIHHLQQRMAAKQQKLETDQLKLSALQEEEQQAEAAARKGDRLASGSSSNSSAADAHGDLLLSLAMQQSMQSMLKELQHDVNNAKSRVRSNQEALRQFEVNLCKLQQQEGNAIAALQTAEAQLNRLSN